MIFEMCITRQIALFSIMIFFAAEVVSCSDTITHIYDCELGHENTPDEDGGDDGKDSQNDSDTEGASDGIDGGGGQGIRPQGWEEFGKRCESHDDCEGIPGGGKCINSILQMVYAPYGYCITCCDEPGIGNCGVGFDCVGVKTSALTYLVCINTCEKDEDCREEDGYVCKPVPYLGEYYPDRKYCMPIVIEEPPEGVIDIDPECDWTFE